MQPRGKVGVRWVIREITIVIFILIQTFGEINRLTMMGGGSKANVKTSGPLCFLGACSRLILFVAQYKDTISHGTLFVHYRIGSR